MKKKILIFVQGLSRGGAERMAANLSLALDDEYEVYIAVYQTKTMATASPYAYRGTLIDLETFPTANPLNKFLQFWKRIYKIRQIKRKYQIDTCFSFMEAANFINVLSGGKRCVLSVREHKSQSLIFRTAYGRVFKVLIRLLYNRAYKVVVNSQGAGNDLIDNFGIKPEKIAVIYNFIDTQYITDKMNEPVPADMSGIYQHPVIAYLGRLVDQKGHLPFLRSFKQMLAQESRLKLVLIGDGGLKDEIVAYARSLGLKTWAAWQKDELTEDCQVFFLGFVKDPFNFLSKASLFVFPSLSEGFPNALVEGMCCGLPVVSADCASGPREILAPETDVSFQTTEAEKTPFGILMPVMAGENSGVEDSWARVCGNMMGNKNDRELYSKFALKRAADFDRSKIVGQWKAQIR